MPFLLPIFLIAASTLARADPSPGTYPLRTTEIEGDLSDLRPIDRMIRGARLVGIGEAAHGSTKFDRLTGRLVRYLVEKRGVRIVFYEADVHHAEAMRDFFLRGKGTAESVAKLLHFANADIARTFRWIRAWNVAHPDRAVSFEPVDIYVLPYVFQTGLDATAERLGDRRFSAATTTAREDCPGHGLKTLAEWNALLGKMVEGKVVVDPDRYRRCLGALRDLRGLLAARAGEWKSRLGKARYAAAAVRSQTLLARQSQIFLSLPPTKDYSPGWNAREAGMAANLVDRWNELGREKKAVFGTHTSHASKAARETDWWKMGYGKITSVGAHLRKKLGDAYRVIAFTGFHIEGVQGKWLEPTSPESLDRRLHEEGHRLTLLDPRKPYVRGRAKWWLQNENAADAYPDGVFLRPEAHYDALIYVDESLASPPALRHR